MVIGSNPIKILIVLYYYHPYLSGLTLLAKAEAEGLAARGHQVTVLTTRHEDALAMDEELNGVRIHRARVLARANKGLISLDFLKKIIAFSKRHHVVNPHLPMAHIGLVVPFIERAKLVPQYHCDLNLGPGIVAGGLERLSYWSMDRTLKGASKIIVTTRDYFEHCRFSQYAAKACAVYPPIDRKRFMKTDPAGLKKKLGIAGHPKLIGFVGRIVEEKGLEYLLRAIPLMTKKSNDFLVLIAGEHEQVAGGSVMPKLRGLLDEHAKHVRVVGRLDFDDLVAFYSLIDVLVLPSVDPLEAFGMVQVEAMLCGTPVIATDMPGVREVIHKTGYGKLVEKRNPKDIAEKIIELIENPIVVRQEGLVEFGFECSIDAYEKIFQNVIS